MAKTTWSYQRGLWKLFTNSVVSWLLRRCGLLAGVAVENITRESLLRHDRLPGCSCPSQDSLRVLMGLAFSPL